MNEGLESSTEASGAIVVTESNQAVEAAVKNWAKEMEKTKAAKTTEMDHKCSRCERLFDTKQGLAVHTRACKLKVNFIESVNSTFSELNNTLSELNASHHQTSPSEHPLNTSIKKCLKSRVKLCHE